jgi:hypothetical protein
MARRFFGLSRDRRPVAPAKSPFRRKALPLTLELLEDRTVPSNSPLIVTNANNQGSGSLRQAIADANALANTDPVQIQFNIPTTDAGYNATTGIFTITLTSSFPAVTHPGVTIDGTSEPGYSTSSTVTGGTISVAKPKVEIVPNPTKPLVIGLDVQANNVAIKAVTIHGFGQTTATGDKADIRVGSVTGADIEQDFIGTSATAFAAPASGLVSGGNNVLVSGSGTLKNNLIGFSSTGSAVSMQSGATSWLVQSNAVSGAAGAGVSVASTSTQDTITQNSIFGNGALGIDIPPLGSVTTSGAPTLSKAFLAGGNLTVTGSAPVGATVEVFIAAPDANGYGEGKTYLTSFIAATGSFTQTFAQPAGVSPGTVLTATATLGGSTSEFCQNIAVDLALTAGALTPPVATEGQAFSNVTVFHFTDADPAGTASQYTAVVTLGDGNTVTLTSTASANGQIVANAGGGFDVRLSYAYAEELSGKTFSVQVNDVGGATTSASTSTFSVADAGLTAGALTPPVATEGLAFSNVTVFHFTDADPNATAGDYTAVATLGDGNSVTLTSAASANGQVVAHTGGGFDVQLSYTYVEELSNKTFSVSVSDAGGATTSASTGTLSVADAGLTAGALTPPVATEGQAFSNLTVFHFSDADPNGAAGDYTAVLTLGDGNSVTLTGTAGAHGQVVAHTGGGFDVHLSYAYADELSNKTFSVSVSDAGGASTSASTSTLSVADAALTDTTPVTNYAVALSASTGTQVLAIFSDANPGAAPSDFTPAVNWNGPLIGTPTVTLQQVSSSATASTWEVLGSAAYSAEGTFTVGVTVTDDGGQTVTTTHTSFTVTNIVTNTNDSGPGSLRQAILNANAASVLSTLNFAIPGAGAHTISPVSALPAITAPTVIDGTSQPGYAGSPLIVLSGAGAGAGVSGLDVIAGNSTVQGLQITQFQADGIRLRTAGGDTVRSNTISGNGSTGVEVADVSATVTGDGQTSLTLDGGSVVVSSSAATLDGQSVSFSGISSLTIAGNATLNGSPTGLGTLSVMGTTLINAATVTTTGAQTYGGAVTLGTNTTLTTTGSGNISFTGTVNGAFALTLVSAGAISAGGAVTVATLSATSTGGQNYGSAVTVSGAATLSGSSLGVAGNFGAGATSLTSTGGSVSIGGMLSAAGTTVSSSAAVSVTGAVNVLSLTATSTGSQSYGLGITDGGTATLHGSQITVTGSFAAASTALTSTSGDVVITGTFNAADTTITSAGAVNVGGAMTVASLIANSNSGQSYASSLSAGGAATLSGGALSVTGALSATATSLSSTGPVNVGGTVIVTSLGVTSTGGQSYGADVNDAGAATLKGSTLSVAGGFAAGSTSLTSTTGAVSVGGLLSTLAATITSAGTVSVGGTVSASSLNVTSSGTQGYGAAVSDTGTATLSGTGLTVTGAFSATTTSLSGSSVSVGGPMTVSSLTATSTGSQSYGGGINDAGAATLRGSQITVTGNFGAATTALTSTSGNVSVSGSLSAAGTTITSAGTVSVGGAMTASTPTVSSTGSQVYGAGMSLTGTATFGGSTVTFDGTVTGDGSHGLTINGNAVFGNAPTSTVTGLTTLSVSGTTAINTTNVTTSSDQTFTGAVTLGSDTTVNAGAGNVTFAATVDGAQNLTVLSGATATFTGVVGGTTPLTSLTVNAPAISVHTVSTTGPQTYGGNATFHSNYQSAAGDFKVTGSTTLADNTSISAANITFGSTVDGAAGQDGVYSLTTSGTGTTTFVGPVGKSARLRNLTTASPGLTEIDGGEVHTAGNATFNNKVHLGGANANTNFDVNGSLLFNGGVSSNDPNFKLSIHPGANSTNLNFAGSSVTTVVTVDTTPSNPLTITGGQGSNTFNKSANVGGNITFNAGPKSNTFVIATPTTKTGTGSSNGFLTITTGGSSMTVASALTINSSQGTSTFDFSQTQVSDVPADTTAGEGTPGLAPSTGTQGISINLNQTGTPQVVSYTDLNPGTPQEQLLPNVVTLTPGSFVSLLVGSPYGDNITTASPPSVTGPLGLPQSGTTVVLGGGNDTINAAAGTTIQSAFGTGGDNTINQVLDNTTLTAIGGSLQNTSGIAGAFATNASFKTMLGDNQFVSLMQSQQFVSLLSDNQFVSLLNSPQFVSLMQSQQFVSLLNDSQFSQFVSLLGSGQFVSLLNNNQFVSLLSNNQFVSLLSNNQFVSLLSNNQFVSLLGSNQFVSLLGSNQFVSLLGSNQFVSLLSNNQFVSLLSSNQFVSLLSNGQFVSLLASNQFVSLLQDSGFVSLLSSSQFVSLLNSSQFVSLLGSNQFVSLLQSGQFVSLLQNKQFVSLLQDSGFVSLLSSTQFVSLLNSSQFVSLLGSGQFVSLLSSGQFVSLLQNKQFVSLLQDSGFVSLLSSTQFVSLLNSSQFVSLLGSSQFVSLLQNGQFVSLLQNKQFVSLLGDSQFVSLLASSQFVSLLNNSQFVSLLSNNQFVSLLQNGQFVSLLNNGQFVSLLQDSQFVSLLGSSQFVSLLNSSQFVSLLTNNQFVSLLQNGQFVSLLQNQQFVSLLSDNAFVSLLSNPQFVSLLTSGQFVSLLSSSQFVSLLQDPQFVSLLNSSQFVSLLNSNQFVRLMSDSQFVSLLSSSQFISLLNSSQFISLLNDSQFVSLLSSSQFVSLLQSQQFVSLLGSTQFISLLQSQQFVSLLSDNQFVSLLNNAQFVSLLNNGQFVSLLGSGQFVSLLQSQQFVSLLQDQQFISLLNNGQFVSLLSNGQFVSLLGSGQFVSLLQSQQFVSLLSDNQFISLLNNGQFVSLLNNSQFVSLLSSGQFISLLQSQQFISLLSDNQFISLLNNGQFVSLLSNNQFVSLLGSGQFVSLLQSQQFVSLLQEQQFISLLSNSQFVSLLNNAQFVSLLNNAQFVSLLSNGQFVSLLGSSQFISLLNNSQFISLLSDSQFVSLMTNSQFVSLLQNSQFISLLSDSRFVSLLQSPQFVSLLQDPKFVSLLQSKLAQDLVLLLSSDTYKQMAAQNPTFVTSLLNADTTALTSLVNGYTLNAFRLNVSMPSGNNVVRGGLLSTFNVAGNGNNLFVQQLTPSFLTSLTNALHSGIDLSQYAEKITFTGSGQNVVNAGLLSQVQAGSGNTRFVIEDPGTLGMSLSSLSAADQAGLLNYGGTFGAGSGTNTYYFVGTGSFGSVKLNQPSGGGTKGLDFSGFQPANGSGVALDLGSTAAQQANANLNLQLSDGAAFTNVVGSPGNDTLTANSGNDVLQSAALPVSRPVSEPAGVTHNVPVQWVYLDFTDPTTGLPFVPMDYNSTGHLVATPSEAGEYTAADQQAILTGLQSIYSAFGNIVQFTLNPSQLPANGNYTAIEFNKTPFENGYFPGGKSDEIDFRNVNQKINVALDINGFIGGFPGQVADDRAGSRQNFRNLTLFVAAHELEHALGGRHFDAFGPIGFGISPLPAGSDLFSPAYPGWYGAFETFSHIIASPASVGLTIPEAANGGAHLGEREAIVLSMIAGGVVNYEPSVAQDTSYPASWVPSGAQMLSPSTASVTLTDGSGNTVATNPPVMGLGELPALSVPNPVTTGFDAGKKFDAAAEDVLGEINPGVTDSYSFSGLKGDLISIDAMSSALSRYYASAQSPDGKDHYFDPVISLYGPDGKLVQTNDNQFEPTDALLMDVTLPQNGTYYVTVQEHIQPGEVIPGSPEAGQPVQNGRYELFIYRFNAYNPGSGNDTFVLNANATGNDTIIGGNGTNTIQATASGNFTLSNSQLTGIGNGTDTLSNIKNAILTDSTGSHTLTVSGWTGGGNISDVGLVGDTLVGTKDTNFTLTNALLTTSDGMSLALNNITNANLTGGAHGSQFDLTGWTGTGTFNGQGGSNTLIGPNLSNTWNIDGKSAAGTVIGANAGNINGKDYFTGMQNLVGGAQNDTFKLYNGGSIAASIDGKGGTNTLDYSSYAGNVTVNLLLHAASLVGGVSGNFAASPTNSIANIQNVTGSQGGGSTDYNILIGDANPNVLTAGAGRSLIIGETGTDTLIGGGTDDILAAGTTAGTTTNYDLNLPALNALLAEWTSSDSYNNRVNSILNVNQANLNKLNGAAIVLAPNSNKPSTGTIIDNSTTDAIVGSTGTGMDLIYYDVSLTTLSKAVSGEKLVNLQGTRATNLSINNGTIAYTPAQLRTAYAVNNLAYDGSGQIIAVVEAYDTPNIFQAVDAFDTQFGRTTAGPNLYDQYGPAASFLTVLGQTGQLAVPLPAADPTGSWEAEEALDIEWAHAMAPGAQIIVVEANSQSLADLMAGVVTAAEQPGVSVVSMSWGFAEGQAVLAQDEALYDGDFTTPAGHTSVTFVASTGDYGTNDPEYPSFSPNVVAVGGTSLYLNADNSYKNEIGWGYFSGQLNAFIGSGGGVSLYEPQPGYQTGVQSTGFRTTPDVSFVADPGTGAWIADSYNLPAGNPWEVVGGTSLSAPAWAGLMALADQGRAAAGEATLSSNGGVEAQQALYHLSSADFNAITSGTNGSYSAVAGYNLVTGLGTPVASRLVPDLVAYQQTSPVNATVRAAGGASGAGAGTANIFNVFNALSFTNHEGGSSSPVLAVRPGSAAVMPRELGHAADLGHGADSASVVHAGSPAATVTPALATADLTVAGDGGASTLRTSGPDASSRSGGEGTLVVGAGAFGNSVLLLNTGILAGYDGNAGNRAGMPWAPLQGSSGTDALIGGSGSDLLVGGAGRDILVGGFAADPPDAAGNDPGFGRAGAGPGSVRDLALESLLRDWNGGDDSARSAADASRPDADSVASGDALLDNFFRGFYDQDQ